MSTVTDGPESDTLQVANLPKDASEELLKRIFGDKVTEVEVSPPQGDATESTATVKFGSVDDASSARQTMDGQTYEGGEKPLLIRFAGGTQAAAESAPAPAQEAAPAAEAGSSGAAAAEGAATSSTTPEPLYIVGLPPGTTSETAKELFAEYGTIISCEVEGPSAAGSLAAVVQYQTEEEVKAVSNALQGMMVSGAPTALSIMPLSQKDSALAASVAAVPPQQVAAPVPTLAATPFSGKGFVQKGVAKGKSPWETKPWDSWDSSSNGYNSSQSGWSGKGDGYGPSQSYYGGGKSYSPYGKGSDKGSSKGSSSMQAAIYNLVQEARLPGGHLGHDDNALHIGGLPLDCEDLDLFHLFSPFGALAPSGVRAMKNPDGSCRGFGFVNYLLPDSMHAAAAKLHGLALPDGAILSVQPKRVGGKGAAFAGGGYGNGGFSGYSGGGGGGGGGESYAAAGYSSMV